ncbi:MAG TPA: ABC transporter permease [Bacteroidales bacterium]|nr:ABC transporter permease [Bacteroidales bacterium]
MLKNYLKIAFRSLWRSKEYSLINVIGLAIGLAAAILILLVVQYETSYDSFYERPEDIYRPAITLEAAGRIDEIALSMTPLGPVLQEKYPEVEAYTRLSFSSNRRLFSYDGTKDYEKGFVYADSGFFKVFTPPIIMGDPETALTKPYSIVITPQLAAKYFGDNDPMGKLIKINNQDYYTVTGVIEPPKSNIHFTYRALASFTTLYEKRSHEAMDQWNSEINYYTYIRLIHGSSIRHIAADMPALIDQYEGDNLKNSGIKISLTFQPVTSIHLHSNRKYDIGPNSDIRYIYIFIAVAVFLILIASINFMNLTTARSMLRAKETGIRKVVGARRGQLVRQYLGEALILTFMSLFIALVVIEFVMPWFRTITGIPVEFNYIRDKWLLIKILGGAFVIGLISGSYPAFYLSGFKPVRVLKGEISKGRNGALFRSMLVVVQFSVSVVLIIATMIIYKQLNYIQHKRLGFDKEYVIIVPLQTYELRQKTVSLKNIIGSTPGVVDVSSSQNYPGNSMSFQSYMFEGQKQTSPYTLASIEVDRDFFDTYHMKLIEGKKFPGKTSDSCKLVIVNEATVKMMGWKEPLGHKIRFNGVSNYQVIGVVADFNYESLHRQVNPIIMTSRPNRFRYLNIRISGNNIDQTLEMLTNKWNEIDPGHPFDYQFLDESFSKLYLSERRLGSVLIYFTGLAVFIALLGLYGLTAFLTERRTREIGIRKVMGASAAGVLTLLGKSFSRWILIAILIASPVAWYLMNNWLSNFAYRTTISPYIFPAAGALVLIVGFLTMSYQSLKASRINPADAIKYE